MSKTVTRQRRNCNLTPGPSAPESSTLTTRLLWSAVLQFLDHCCSSATVAYPRKNPAIRPVPKKLFDKTGKEIKSVFQLIYDQDIWLSFGEPWRTPYSQSHS